MHDFDSVALRDKSYLKSSRHGWVDRHIITSSKLYVRDLSGVV